MPIITGNDRNQFSMICLEQEIGKDAEVRLIDAFIDWLPLEEMRFVNYARPVNWRNTVKSILKSIGY